LKKLRVDTKRLERLMTKTIKCIADGLENVHNGGVYKVIEENGPYYCFLDDSGIETDVYKACFREL